MNLHWRERRYPSDLTDREWAILKPLLAQPQHQGRPVCILCQRSSTASSTPCAVAVRGACSPRTSLTGRRSTTTSAAGSWTALGNGFIRRYESGPESVLAARRRRVRPSSTASRSAPVQRGGVRGYDGAKRLMGRKRHLLVDTLGLVVVEASVLSITRIDMMADCIRSGEFWISLSRAWKR